MKPQPQTRKEPNGDCLRACVASLLEVNIDRVPDFVLAPELPDSPYPSWWVALQSWLAEMGLFFLEMQLPPNMPFMPLPLAAFCIFFGKTEKGVNHAIVGRIEGDQFAPVFNPWPEAEIGGVGALGFIIPRDPSTPVHLGRALERVGRFATQVSGPFAEQIAAEVDTALQRNLPKIDGLIS